jgi:hypothetical protein
MTLFGKLWHIIFGHEWEATRLGAVRGDFVERFECYCGHYGLARGLGRIVDMGPNR